MRRNPRALRNEHHVARVHPKPEQQASAWRAARSTKRPGRRLNSIAQKRALTFDMSGGPKGAKRPLGRPLDGGVRRLVDHDPQRLNYSSMNFHVFAPSNRRTRTDVMSSGSKFPRFTPCFAPDVACNGSQCVTHPQVLQ